MARTTVALAGPPAALAAVEQACPDTRTLLSCAGTAKVAQVMLRDPALDAAEDQREVIRRLDAVVREARVRLVLVNGRLDEAVGRAVETAGRAGRADRGHEGGTDLGAGELAGDLRALREALEEVASPGHDRRPVAPPQDQPRRATSAD